MEAVATDKQLKMITNIIEYLRYEQLMSGVPVCLEINDLLLTPELEVDLNCVGLAGCQTTSGCIIAWREELEIAKNSLKAEAEYKRLSRQRPEEGPNSEDYED